MKTQIDNLAKYALRRAKDGANKKEVDFLDNMRKCIIESYNASVVAQSHKSDSTLYRNTLLLLGVDSFIVEKMEKYTPAFVQRLVFNQFQITQASFDRIDFLWQEHYGQVVGGVAAIRDFQYWYDRFKTTPNEVNADMCAMIEDASPLLQTPDLFRVADMYSDKQLRIIIESRLTSVNFQSWANS